jgi:hypothetical protein
MRIVLFLTIIVAASGCMSFAPSPFQRGSVVLAGDAEGVEALMDGLNGFVANGKTQDAMGDSAHWHHRKEQESQRTRRSGIFQKLTSTEK